MKNVLLIMLFAAIVTGSAFAQYAPSGQHSQPAQASATKQKTGKGTGLIQQIDRDKGVLIIKHGPLKELDMPAMTMTYQVKGKEIPANLQPLQKVDFELTYDGKDYLITRIN